MQAFGPSRRFIGEPAHRLGRSTPVDSSLPYFADLAAAATVTARHTERLCGIDTVQRFCRSFNFASKNLFHLENDHFFKQSVGSPSQTALDARTRLTESPSGPPPDRSTNKRTPRHLNGTLIDVLRVFPIDPVEKHWIKRDRRRRTLPEMGVQFAPS
jgi:hypothetical protein